MIAGTKKKIMVKIYNYFNLKTIIILKNTGYNFFGLYLNLKGYVRGQVKCEYSRGRSCPSLKPWPLITSMQSPNFQTPTPIKWLFFRLFVQQAGSTCKINNAYNKLSSSTLLTVSLYSIFK